MKDNNSRAKCAVLLSTYNGENFLRKQLDSIIEQRDVEIVLYVRDDGSTDGTLNIIKEYQKRVELRLYEDGLRMGPGKSFLTLLDYAIKNGNEDYYAFADQDDIWLEDKLATAVLADDCDAPFLYCSNQYVYEEEVNKGVRHVTDPDMTFIGHLYRNLVAGCTFVLNRAMAQKVMAGGIPSDVIIKHRLHDAWILLVALGIGRVYYDSTPHILYRIHANNTVGLDNKVSPMKRIKDFLAGDGKHYVSYQADYLLKHYDLKVSQSDQEYLRNIANYTKSVRSKIFMLGNDTTCKLTGVSKAKYMMRIILNYF